MTCHNCRNLCRSWGRHRNGLRRYRCETCGKTFTEPHERPYGNMYLPLERGLLPLQLVAEGASIRSTERITGTHRDTIMSLIVAAGERCKDLLRERVRGLEVEDVQADEIWGFVYKKEKHKNPFAGDDMYMGDAWCFVGIERHTKLVLAWELGKRTERSTERFMAKLAAATDSDLPYQLTTDGLATYPRAVYKYLGERVDYAQYIKIYAQTVEGERRYSPPECVGAEKKPIYGYPDKSRICTSHVERQNLTIRTFMRRMTRLTCAFSKKWQNLDAALALHFAYYNFCRVHRSLKRRTPAMAAGITDHVWKLEELLR